MIFHPAIMLLIFESTPSMHALTIISCIWCCRAAADERPSDEEKYDDLPSSVKVSNTAYPELFPRIKVTKKVL